MPGSRPPTTVDRRRPGGRLGSRALALALAACLATPASATAAPLPVPKPEASPLPGSARSGAPAVVEAPIAFDERAVAAVRTGLSALDLNDLTGALAAVSGRSQLESDVVLWLAIRRQVAGLTPELVEAFAARNPTWPSATLFKRRAEQALVRLGMPPRELAAALSGGPVASEEGRLALVRALVATDRKPDAAKLLAPWWASEMLPPERERAILAEFGELLTKADHKARYDLLMYADRTVQAATVGALVGGDWVTLARARQAMLRQTADAARELDKVAGEARSDPLYAFTLAELLRRDDRNKEAAEALLSVPVAKTLAHADAWWVERRIVSRGLLEDRDYGKAYALADAHEGGDAETVAEAHFHAGWYALRFLGDPGRARPHFEALRAAVSLPLSRSRANYWLGRTEEAAGKIELARSHYAVAAADEATFYGQLARVKLGKERLEMPPVPEPTEEDRAAFRENVLARAFVLLTRAGARRDATPLALDLARQLPSGGQVAILADYLHRLGDHRAALQVGKAAADRQLGTERLAFPLEALPDAGRTQKLVETALVYAIARQESAFDPAAVSTAGAMGLLQLLPATAQETARTLGLPFSRPRLTTDADYNATLGAAYLNLLVEEFGGSYILAFAAYNAGKRRAREWIQRFGDPRNPDVDPVDWIELIPFGETRSYVQRVTENLQVYRERLADSRLAIAEDLRRSD